MSTLTRIGLWFSSLLISITLFSLFLGLLLFSARSFRIESLFIVFRTTMLIALPVWCLYLPFAISLKDAESRQFRTFITGGTLIGPALLGLWGIILQLKGGDPNRIWFGELVGGLAEIVFALIVGFLTTFFYVHALKILYRRSTAPLKTI